MGYVLSENKRQQVIALGQLGWSMHRIHEATGVDRRTARGYLTAAGVAVRPPRHRREPNCASQSQGVITGSIAENSRSATPDESAKLHQSVLTGSATPFPSTSECLPHREFIVESISRGRNAMAIWQDLVVDAGVTFKYSSVQRFVRRLSAASPEAHPRIETPPGEEAQVDYGDGARLHFELTTPLQRS